MVRCWTKQPPQRQAFTTKEELCDMLYSVQVSSMVHACDGSGCKSALGPPSRRRLPAALAAQALPVSRLGLTQNNAACCWLLEASAEEVTNPFAVASGREDVKSNLFDSVSFVPVPRGRSSEAPPPSPQEETNIFVAAEDFCTAVAFFPFYSDKCRFLPGSQLPRPEFAPEFHKAGPSLAERGFTNSPKQ